jgi:predicted transcriptional regulator YheO
VVGAICINVDANYLTEEVVSASDKMASFIQTFCRTDMKVEENILSRDEYAKALRGKRHFKDDRFE